MRSNKHSDDICIANHKDKRIKYTVDEAIRLIVCEKPSFVNWLSCVVAILSLNYEISTDLISSLKVHRTQIFLMTKNIPLQTINFNK